MSCHENLRIGGFANLRLGIRMHSAPALNTGALSLMRVTGAGQCSPPNSQIMRMIGMGIPINQSKAARPMTTVSFGLSLLSTAMRLESSN